MRESGNDALVLFSGGQDSTTCLAWALERYDRVETCGFRYGQRHMVEMAVRAPILAGLRALDAEWDARLGADHVVDLGEGFAGLEATALTSQAEIRLRDDGLPTTFVPGRNLLFLVYAAALAERRDLHRLVGGMCETDYSGYPDCRDATIRAQETAIRLGFGRAVPIDTPLMSIDKAATWQLSRELGGDGLIALIVEQTHTCYLGDRTHRHAWGYGCGECPACALRAQGWTRWRDGPRADTT